MGSYRLVPGQHSIRHSFMIITSICHSWFYWHKLWMKIFKHQFKQFMESMRGPVKLMDRARAKAQNDYAKEPYPASACVIDFNRCALIFDDISSLLCGLK